MTIPFLIREKSQPLKHGILDIKLDEQGSSDRCETRVWERLSHNRQIELVDRQSLIEAKKEMEKYGTLSLQQLLEIRKKDEISKIEVMKSPQSSDMIGISGVMKTIDLEWKGRKV